MTEPDVQRFDYAAADYQGNQITVTMVYDHATRVIFDVLVHRDVGCVYDTVLLGSGGDEPGSVQFRVPEGDTQIKPGELAGYGIATVDDFAGHQITVATTL